MLNSRRHFLKLLAAASLSPTSAVLGKQELIVNDAHSQLNETRVSSIQHLRSLQEAVKTVGKTAKQGRKLAICGARHAGGGQQFAAASQLIDISDFNRVLSFDKESGLIEVEPGSLIDHAIKYKGRYYLTYHRFARKEQVLVCYPEFPAFLAQKLKYDPKLVFCSDWYQHYATMFS